MEVVRDGVLMFLVVREVNGGFGDAVAISPTERLDLEENGKDLGFGDQDSRKRFG
jgi:hypothetical protein